MIVVILVKLVQLVLQLVLQLVKKLNLVCNEIMDERQILLSCRKVMRALDILLRTLSVAPAFIATFSRIAVSVT